MSLSLSLSFSLPAFSPSAANVWISRRQKFTKRRRRRCYYECAHIIHDVPSLVKALVILIRLHCCSLSGKPKWNHSYGLISKLCRNRSGKWFVRAVPLEQLWQEAVNSKQNLSRRYYSGRGAVRSRSHVKVLCVIKSIDEVAVNNKSVCAAPVYYNASCRLCCSWTGVWGKRMEMMWLFGLFFNICQVCLYCFWTGVRRKKSGATETRGDGGINTKPYFLCSKRSTNKLSWWMSEKLWSPSSPMLLSDRSMLKGPARTICERPVGRRHIVNT